MWLYFLILLIVVLGIWIYRNNQFIKFEVDNKQYQIEKYSPARYQSLDTLVQIRKKLDRLVNHLYRKHPNDKYIKRMKIRFDQTVLREANPDGDPTQTSYTINKGDTMVICLRSNDKQLVDINTLMYVAIHELAHVYSSSFHHSDEFWRNMKFLIDQASEIGIYRPVNYTETPVRYCGLTISSNIPRSGGKGPRIELPRQKEIRGINGKGNNQKFIMIDAKSQSGGGIDLIPFLLSRSYMN